MIKQLIVLAVIEALNHIVHALCRGVWVSSTVMDIISFVITMAVTFIAGMLISKIFNGSLEKCAYIGFAVWFVSSFVFTWLDNVFDSSLSPSEVTEMALLPDQGFLIAAFIFLPVFVGVAMFGGITERKLKKIIE